MKELQRTYLDLLGITRRLLASPEIEACWDQPSALLEYRTSALAGHLVECAAVRVINGLDAPAPTQVEPLSTTAFWVWGLNLPGWDDHYSEVHVWLREAGQQQVAGGYRAFLEDFDRIIHVLTDRLQTAPDDRLLSILGGQVVTRLDEYLKSRVIECVVHIDDLAASAGLPTPIMPGSAMRVTIYELIEIARAHRGDLAIVRALSRRERDSINALRVL
jgi:hypothetical protein